MHLIDNLTSRTRKESINRPVSYSNVWTGSSMKWRLMRANQFAFEKIVDQSLNHSVNQSVNPSIRQSINQLISVKC